MPAFLLFYCDTKKLDFSCDLTSEILKLLRSLASKRGVWNRTLLEPRTFRKHPLEI